ncbi:MAG: class I SAM-dependent methyltransferase [Leptolyngbya sp. SIO1E4]|nr:class I SAM-dependent methyltransferase [Leptolyngbya sp. SIO1E4]
MKLFSGMRKLKRVMQTLEPVQLLDESSKRFLVERYAQKAFPELGYATVRDFCDSVDHLPQICYLNGDLKNVQRAWTVKAILGTVPPGSKLLEVGGGVPLVAGMLAELGYQVTLVDPYEGAGNGPTEYEAYIRQFPNVTFVKSLFDSNLAGYAESSFDCIYSVSVLEHIPQQGIEEIYNGIHKFLKPGGHSIHCVDVVIQGKGTQRHENTLRDVLYLQKLLQEINFLRNDSDQICNEMLLRLKDDLETFYLSAMGHNLWRGSQPYDEFPFRKVVSIQTCVPYTSK